MTYKTHLSFSMAVTLIPLPLTAFWTTLNPFSQISSVVELSIASALIFISALAPDLDEPGSYLSKRFPWMIVSVILSIFTTHRGATHLFIAPFIYALLIAIISAFFLKDKVFDYLYMTYFLIVPYMFHLIGDGFTKGGIRRFMYPFSKKTFWTLPKSLRFYTGSFTENIYLVIFTLIIVLELFLYLKMESSQFLLSLKS